MAPKRRNAEGGDDVTGREKKKLKMTAARTIAIQPNAQAGSSKSAVARPSPSGAADNSTKLPSAIDVEKFVEARAFEINAMHAAMKTANANSTHRVWQTLPRHLRRRAASHDVRRVPLRLRERARAEMDVVRKKALGRSMPKHGKGKRISRTDSFLKRQRDKIWLETHLWHAKRMHMENMWGYRLAVRPTEKAYRPSYRASVHGAILHDASYYSLLEVKGPVKLLKTALEQICDPQRPGPGSQRYLTGSRALDMHVYKLGCYPYDLIAPVTIIWKPLLNSEESVQDPSQAKPTGKKGKGKEKAPAPSTAVAPSDPLRVCCVWLRFHPSVHAEVLDTLKQSVSRTLAEHKAIQPDSEELKLEIADLRGQVNVFEILGPKSSQVIKGALNPIASDDRKDFLQFWSSLTDLQSSGSIPRSMIIGFKVNDPRLKFPPKNARPQIQNGTHIASPSTAFPSAQLAQNELWDETVRGSLVKPRYKKKDLDERRSKNEIPGTPLQALRQDDRIPVLLIQRSLEAQNSDGQAIHGWTLMIPAGWSMAFFSSLTYTSSRVGGQRERQTQAYESGTAYFPRDYPFAATYDEWAAHREATEKAIWDRKPPAKRVNYEKLGTSHPWKASWDTVLGIEGKEDTFVPTERESALEMPPEEPKTRIRPWLLRGSYLAKLLSHLSSVLNHGAALLGEINKLRVKRGHEPLPGDVKSGDLLQGALINVKIIMCSRGAPQDLAMIYSLGDGVVRQWEKALHLRQTSKVAMNDDTPLETELADVIPEQDAIIGYVTTGHYSLARGHGYGIGAIPLTKWLELEQQNTRLHPNRKFHSLLPTMLVGVRNTDGMQCRAANLEVLLED